MNIYGTDQYQKFVEDFLKEVKFDCDFKDNICVCVRTDGVHPEGTPEIPCCCGHCAEAYGYLYKWDIPGPVMKYYTSRYDKDMGFYRKEVGCILERKYRSVICNAFICLFLKKKMKEERYYLYCSAHDRFMYGVRKLEDLPDPAVVQINKIMKKVRSPSGLIHALEAEYNGFQTTVCHTESEPFSHGVSWPHDGDTITCRNCMRILLSRPIPD